MAKRFQSKASVHPSDAPRARAARQIGTSPFAVALMEAAGIGGGESLAMCPTVKTIDEVAAFMGVSGRTVSTWKTKGMPGGENGEPYCLPAVLRWRRDQPEPEAWHHTGNPLLQRREASGDLARAILRLVRHRLRQGLAMAVKDFMAVTFKEISAADRDLIEASIQSALAHHCIKPLCLSDDEIEGVLADCWGFV